MAEINASSQQTLDSILAKIGAKKVDSSVRKTF